MQDVHVETEVLTLPLRFAMAASRTAAALKGAKQGQQLNEKEKHSLRALSGLLKCALQGGEVLRQKSMAGYSAAAMSAYRLVQEIQLPEAKVHDLTTEVNLLEQIIKDLHSIEESKPTKLPLDVLQRFSTLLTKRSLDESAGRPEEALQM
jgi:hypothetical protein